MGLLSNAIGKVRQNPRLLRMPPYLSLLCILGGVVWLLLLPLDEYSRQTYISENALLPGQVHTYYGGSEHNIFRAYRHEVARVIIAPWTHDENGTRIDLPLQATEEERGDKFEYLFKNAGLKVGRQRYQYRSGGDLYKGENIYGILHAPRGDGTEAIVLVAPVRNIENEVNLNGVTLLVSLAKYMKRWSLWSKDIIFLITPDSTTGSQAWIDAYHSQHDPRLVGGLPLKSGALQGAVVIDYALQDRFEKFHVAYDGINGQLPNLDLVNTAVTISSGQMGIPNLIQGQQAYSDDAHRHHWTTRVLTMGKGMASQALGHATGAHSVFMPYHIDAVTLTAVGHGWQDEMAFGRTIESICRSLNNLLEKLHQSFFFYLLMQSNRFVSIGTYLPSAMIVGAAYTVMAIYLWVLSGYKVTYSSEAESEQKAKGSLQEKSDGSKDESFTVPLNSSVSVKTEKGAFTDLKFVPVERDLVIPVSIITGLYLSSIFPVIILTHVRTNDLIAVYGLLVMTSLAIPFGIAVLLFELPAYNIKIAALSEIKPELYVVMKSLSLLILGLCLTVLATINFSLSMFLGVLCAPLAFVSRVHSKPILALPQYLLLLLLSPAGVSIGFFAYTYYTFGDIDINKWLAQLAFGWNVWGSWGVLVGVICVWWPAWAVGAMLVVSSWIGHRPPSKLDKQELRKLVDEIRKKKEDEIKALNAPRLPAARTE